MFNSGSLYTSIKCKHTNSRSNQKSIERFLEQIRIGPDCIFVICNRILCKYNVASFNKKYNFETISRIITVWSFDSQYYICRTCNSKIKKSSVPWQAVCNNLYLDGILKEILLQPLKNLLLISKRFLFQKVRRYLFCLKGTHLNFMSGVNKERKSTYHIVRKVPKLAF